MGVFVFADELLEDIRKLSAKIEGLFPGAPSPLAQLLQTELEIFEELIPHLPNEAFSNDQMRALALLLVDARGAMKRFFAAQVGGA